MSTRIDGSASQASQFTPDSNEVESASSPEVGRTGSTSAAASDRRASADTIEAADGGICREDDSRTADIGAGPSVSAHLLNATGGKSGHKALERKEEQPEKDEYAPTPSETYKPDHDGEDQNAFQKRDLWSKSQTLEENKYVRKNGHFEKETGADKAEKEAEAKEAEKQSAAKEAEKKPGAKDAEKSAVKEAVKKPAPRNAEKKPAKEQAERTVKHAAAKPHVAAKIWETGAKHSAAVWQSPEDWKHGKVALDEAEVHYGAAAQYGNGKFVAQGQVGAGLYLVDADVHARQKLGAVSLKEQGYLKAGVDADLKAKLEWDPKSGTVGGRVGGEAFAGVAAGGSVNVEAGGVGVGAQGKVELGLGIDGGVDGELKDGKIKLKADLGVCIGIGGDVKFDVDIDAKKVGEEVVEGGKELVETGEKVSDAVHAAEVDAAKAAVGFAAHEVANAANDAVSFLDKARTLAGAVKSGAEGLEKLAGN